MKNSKYCCRQIKYFVELCRIKIFFYFFLKFFLRIIGLKSKKLPKTLIYQCFPAIYTQKYIKDKNIDEFGKAWYYQGIRNLSKLDESREY